MKHTRFLSFSKLLSRRILMVNVATISVIALLIIAFATVGLKTMTNAYFISGLYASHESISKRLGEVPDDSLYRHIRKMDIGMNAFNPLFNDDINEKDDKDVHIRSRLSARIAAERNVDVAAQEAVERHVPAPPEIGDGNRLIGRVEVHRNL